MSSRESLRPAVRRLAVDQVRSVHGLSQRRGLQADRDGREGDVLTLPAGSDSSLLRGARLGGDRGVRRTRRPGDR
jgi:hypothetical protein